MKLKIYELDNIKDEVLKMTKYYIDQLPIPFTGCLTLSIFLYHLLC